MGDEKPYRIEQIKALSWETAQGIIKRFEDLNPYDRCVVSGCILKIEDENFEDESRTRRRQLYGRFLAAKRYALFNYEHDGRVIIRKPSEDGLGHLLNPVDPDDPSKDWIGLVWKQIILEELGRPTKRPPWFERPAASQETISSARLLKPFLRQKGACLTPTA